MKNSFFWRNKEMLALLVFSLLVRVLFLGSIPFRVDGDASRIALDGMKAWQEKWPLFGTGWSGYANGSFYLIGLFLKIFGNNVIGSRIFSATGGFIGVISVYFLARRFFDKKVAFFSSFFLCFSFFHLVISRVGLDVSWATFFVPVTILLFIDDRWWVEALAGVIFGFSQYFYPGARIILLLLGFMSIDLLVFKKRTVITAIKALVLMSLGFFFVYYPMIRYYFVHPQDYWARVSIVGIFQSGWLKNELQTRSVLEIFFTQFKNCFLVFWVPVKAGAHFWVFRTPYLEKVASIFFTIGLLKSILSVRKKYPYSFLLFYFFLGVILAGVLTVDSPTASRYALVFPAISILFGVGVDWLISYILPKKRMLAQIIILTAFMFEGIYLYWNNEFKDSYKFDINTQIASYAGRYLSKKNDDFQIYFLGNDYLYYDAIPTLPFMVHKKGINIFKPIEKEEAVFEKPSYFIILPYRNEDLNILKEIYPQGKSMEFKNPLGCLLFYLFEI